MNRKIILSFITFCLLLTAFSASVSVVNGQTKRQINQAKKLAGEGDKSFQKKDYQAAINKYAEAIALVPNFPDTHYWKGYAHYYLNEYDLALAEMDAALERGYKPLDVYKLRWFLNYQKKDFEAALKDVEQGLQLEPSNLTFNLAVGELNFAKGSYKQALAAYEKAVEIDPNNADAHYSIAASYAALGDTDKQLLSALEAVKRNTKFLGEAYFLVGDGYQKAGKYNEAVTAYLKAMSAKPDIYATYHNLSDIYRNQNRFEEAITITKKGLVIFPNDANLYTDLGWYNSLGNHNFEAIIASKKAVELAPEQYAGYTNLCRAYYETKQYDLALSSCNTALRLNPSDGEANVYLGFTYLSLNKEETANKFFAKAVDGLREFTKNNPDYSDGFYLLGNAYYYVGQPKDAIEAYNKCLQLSPRFAKARYNLGLTYFVTKNMSAANEQYEELLKMDKDLAAKLKQTIDKK
jgi:superkiller protein 3